MADRPGVRRLHPRLRVFKNGDRFVNAVRSDATTTMACALPAFDTARGVPPAPALAASAPDVGALRNVIEAPKRKLGRRPKFDEQPRADMSFVNVLVELLFGSGSDVPPDVQSKERKHLDAILDRAVASAKRASLAAAKLPRRTFISATVPVSMLEDLQEHPAVCVRAPFGSPQTGRTTCQPRERAARQGDRRRGDARTRRGVLIGIIDVGGFDFAHPIFWTRRGHAVRGDLGSASAAGGRRRMARGFDYGSEITKAHMDAAIAAARSAACRPRRCSSGSRRRRPGSHGTHVASIAAGNTGVCPEAHDRRRADRRAAARRSDRSDAARRSATPAGSSTPSSTCSRSPPR